MQLFPALLGGGAAAGAAAGSSVALTQAATTMQIIGQIVGITAGIAGAVSASNAAKANAAIAEDNAKRATQEAAAKAQEQDVKARGELGAFLAESGASGLSLGSGSTLLRRQSLTELAAKDRGYITYEGAREATNFKQTAADYRAEARSARNAGFFNAVGGALEIGSTLISGASEVNRLKKTSVVG